MAGNHSVLVKLAFLGLILTVLLQLVCSAAIYSNVHEDDKRASPAAWGDMHAWGKRAWQDLQAWGKRSAPLGGDDFNGEPELAGFLRALASSRARRAKVGDWQSFSGWGRR